ncbi:MAG: PilZ domain-containing protein [Candidatus Sulfotelmatobacter sp.]
MADEEDAGAAYLAALKQSVPLRAAAVAPARAPVVPRSPEPRTGVAKPTPGAEKRRSPRYRCQGSAHINEIGKAVAIWTTFTDISLHGCYVEATTTYRVGVRLGLKLEANGFRVETIGEVRVSYPRLGMGIVFSQMSEGDRERLRELVRSISRPSVILGARVATPTPSTLQPEGSPQVANPAAALQAMMNFFEDRHMMGREEFLGILRKGQ